MTTDGTSDEEEAAPPSPTAHDKRITLEKELEQTYGPRLTTGYTYMLSHCCCTVVTLLLHCCYTAVTRLLHCCYTAVTLTLLLHGCYTTVTLLLHYCTAGPCVPLTRSTIYS
jgi:hypothetical protein